MPSRGINILRKIIKIMAYFLLIIGMFSIVLSIVKFTSWQLKKDNYIEKYAYNMGDFLFFYEGDKPIYVYDILDVLGNKKEIEVPVGSAMIVYLDNSKPNSCIYFDINNTFDAFALNPASGIGYTYILFGAFLFFIFAKALEKEYIFIMPKALRFFAKIIFLLGLIVLIVGRKEVNHIVGGIIMIILGVHFNIIDDVVKSEDK